ncbi:MAG: DUF6175 family protein [Bacteroidales bacterium]|nr:DUF6175 family protein [Bacteroidales bacterium]
MNKYLLFLAIFALTSCGGNNASQDNSTPEQTRNNLVAGVKGNMKGHLKSEVNSIEQALPQIMIIPADQTLKNFGALKTKRINGKNHVLRDYQKYLHDDDRFRRLSASIQNTFVKNSFPLNDLEQTLKQLNTRDAVDMASNLEQDAKTLLLQTAQPDIILELNYFNSTSLSSHDYRDKSTSYTLTAFDAYSNKSISAITSSNIKGESTTETIQNDIEPKLPELMKDLQFYYSDILTRGREITVRIVVEKGSNINLQDESIEGDTYSDWIIDFIKGESVKGAYKMQLNTKNELYFVNVRIPLINEDGTQYGVYDFTRDLQKNLRKNLGLQSTNDSQGLGEVVLTVKQL